MSSGKLKELKRAKKTSKSNSVHAKYTPLQITTTTTTPIVSPSSSTPLIFNLPFLQENSQKTNTPASADIPCATTTATTSERRRKLSKKHQGGPYSVTRTFDGVHPSSGAQTGPGVLKDLDPPYSRTTTTTSMKSGGAGGKLKCIYLRRRFIPYYPPIRLKDLKEGNELTAMEEMEPPEPSSGDPPLPPRDTADVASQDQTNESHRNKKIRDSEDERWDHIDCDKENSHSQDLNESSSSSSSSTFESIFQQCDLQQLPVARPVSQPRSAATGRRELQTNGRSSEQQQSLKDDPPSDSVSEKKKRWLENHPNFVIEQKVGSGHYGNVWLARDQVSGRKVAVKTLVKSSSVTPSILPPSPLKTYLLDSPPSPPATRRQNEQLLSVPSKQRKTTLLNDIEREASILLALSTVKQTPSQNTHSGSNQNVPPGSTRIFPYSPEFVACDILHDELEGSVYEALVMEYCEGNTLRQFLRAYKAQPASSPVPIQLIVEIALQLTKSIARLHQQNIAHRDLKPENIVLSGWNSGLENPQTSDPQDGISDSPANISTELNWSSASGVGIRLMDFGFAGVFPSIASSGDSPVPPPSSSPSTTPSMQNLGALFCQRKLMFTLAYISPEFAQVLRLPSIEYRRFFKSFTDAEFSALIKANDVWAVGTILYEMVCKKRCIQTKISANDSKQVSFQRVAQDLDAKARIADLWQTGKTLGIPDGFLQVTAACLHPDWQQRPDATAAYQALKQTKATIAGQ